MSPGISDEANDQSSRFYPLWIFLFRLLDQNDPPEERCKLFHCRNGGRRTEFIYRTDSALALREGFFAYRFDLQFHRNDSGYRHFSNLPTKPNRE